jgi:hypothetical protein
MFKERSVVVEIANPMQKLRLLKSKYGESGSMKS